MVSELEDIQTQICSDSDIRVAIITGEETLTEGSAANISGAFFRQEDAWSQGKEGLFQGADVVVLVKTSVTINKDDKLTYDSEDYRVISVVTRKLGTVSFYKTVRCKKIA